MSATGRGGERIVNDFYPTPKWCVDRLIEVAPWTREGTILEPSAGNGAIIRALNVPRENVLAVEIQEECRTALEEVAQGVIIADFLTWSKQLTAEYPDYRFDVAIDNPPFSRALEFIQACWPIARRIVMLLRLNFFGSAERQPWFAAHPPNAVLVLPNRPSFTNPHGTRKSSSDNCEYAWCAWDTEPAAEGQQRFGVLELTSDADRGITRGRKRAKPVEQQTTEQ